MRVVADTNFLISSIFWNGAPYRIVQQALDGRLEIITSQAILNEVRKVLRDPKEDFNLEEQEMDDVIHGILAYAKVVEPGIVMRVVTRDPKDDPIIACAITAKAKFILTR